MAKYDVYGIGNALVDMEFEVNPEFLTKMEIDKGLMTLVDQNRQGQLLESLTGIHHKRTCGGSAANTIIAVSQLGGQSFYSCKIANDETGDFYYKDLESNGVVTNLGDGSRPEGTTGKCMVFITPDADRTMNTYLGITETFSIENLVESEISDSKYLYIEGYLVTSPTGKAAAIKAKEIAEKNGVKTSITFSDPGIVGHFKNQFDEIIGNGVDLLFCNEEEALSYTGETDIKNAFEKLKSVAKSFAITQGPRGALIYDGEKEIDVLTNKVDAIDTNGAGDLFAGSYLYGITNGHSVSESAKLACSASSKLVTQFGARLSKEQLLGIKKDLL